MQIIKVENIRDFKQLNKQQTDVCIGFFDAVHLGHDAVIKQVEKSEKQKAIITFDSHPNKVSILSIESKIDILKSYQIDFVIVINFNFVNQNIEIEEFIDFLKKVNTNKITVGKDFRFGKKAAGSTHDLAEYFNVNIVEFIKKGDDKLASSVLRKAIFNGDLAEYKLQTGRDYAISGNVVMGDQIGRTMNFPTANLQTNDLVIRNGVYVTEVEIEGKRYQSITNIGMRPTVNGKKLQIESHIFDFNDIIYSKQIKVIFYKLIRLELKFDSLEELKDQIKKDMEYAKEYYGN